MCYVFRKSRTFADFFFSLFSVPPPPPHVSQSAIANHLYWQHPTLCKIYIRDQLQSSLSLLTYCGRVKISFPHVRDTHSFFIFYFFFILLSSDIFYLFLSKKKMHIYNVIVILINYVRLFKLVDVLMT